MSRDFPALIDPLQMVTARRGFKGTWPLSGFERLSDLLESTDGEARFELQFGRDEIGTPYLEMVLAAQPWLLCQRTLEPFRFPLERTVRLGLVTHEADEASLPAGYEPLLVTAEPMRVTALVEDELILALPLVPTKEGEPLSADFGEPADAGQEQKESPFAALAALKGGENSKQDQ